MSSGPLLNIRPAAAVPSHPVWDEVKPAPPSRGGFVPAEFNYPHQMDVAFLRLLYRIRMRAGVPMRIVSDHRPPARNAAAGGASQSAHMEEPCRAVDLRVLNNYERFRIVRAAIIEGVVRIGVYPAKTDNSGSVHIDASTINPGERIWTRY